MSEKEFDEFCKMAENLKKKTLLSFAIKEIVERVHL
jgi:hypothetical protein